MPDPVLSRRHCLALALAATGGRPALATDRTGLPVLSYYDYPPFSTGPGQGLTRALLALLQDRAGPLLPPLHEELLPRRRVAALVGRSDWIGLVPWVSPAWFQDPDQHRFIWTDPLMQDEDLVVSLKSQPVDYQGPASLRGLTLGGVFGHVYPETESLVKAGEVQRLDSFSQEACLRMLLMGRVHVIFMSRSGLAGWRQRVAGFDARLHLAEQPRQRYQRRLLLSPLMPAEQSQWLVQTAAGLLQDPAWRDLLQQHGVELKLS
ncbi:substrate-binding periplasmic protein [Roseateles sp. DB2]|uniref:substrate-binding periplasmic protein n=1 Tax=Roseateles sp. DB2 TaxID=3453717 RepID=UPI003EEA0C12